MHHRLRAALGPLTLLPLVWACICAVRIAQWWTDPPLDMDEVMVAGDAVKLMTQYFSVLATGTAIVALLSVLMLFAFVVDASSSAQIPDEQRGMWCLVLLLGLGLTMPAYWWCAVRGRQQTPVETAFAAPAA